MIETTIGAIVGALGAWATAFGAIAALSPRRKYPILLRFFTVGAALIVLLGCAVLVPSWWTARSLASDEAAIRRTILRGTELELQWYKNPKADMLNDLSHYFVPVDQGGERLREIVRHIDDMRAKGQYYPQTASRALFVNRVSLLKGSDTASAETSEHWYQPQCLIVNGTPQPTEQTASQLNFNTPTQYYMLRKVNGTWLIQSNPAPVAPSTPTPPPGASDTPTAPQHTC